MLANESLRVAPKILIVDDDPALLEALPEMLTLRLPYVQVESCDSGQAALTHLTRTPYHAVISDLHMPRMDGLTLLTEAQKSQPDIPFLLITAAGERNLALRALQKGAYDFITKPLDRDEMTRSIRWAMKTYDLRLKVASAERRLVRIRQLLMKLQEHHGIAGELLDQARFPDASRRIERSLALYQRYRGQMLRTDQTLQRSYQLLKSTETIARRRAWVRLQNF